MSRKTPVLLGMLLVWLVALGPAVRAANPRVTLHVENATGPEVARALTKVSGVAVEWDDPGGSPTNPARATFDWKDVPFSRALSDAAERFHIGVGQGQLMDGFQLTSDSEARVGSHSETGVVEADGYRLSVASAGVETRKSVEFSPAGQRSHAQLTLRIAVETPDGDAESVSSIENVTARDDLGRLLKQPPDYHPPHLELTRPDECQERVTLEGWDPRSSKLVSLSGELVVFPHFHAESVSLPFPLPASNGERKLCGRSLDLVRLTPPGGAVGESPRLEIRLTSAPGREPAGSARPDQLSATLFLASGAPFRINGGSGGVRGGDASHPTTYTSSHSYPPLPEAAGRIVIRFRDQGNAQTALNFRMTDIPLPRPGSPEPPFVSKAYQMLPADITDGQSLMDLSGGTLTGKVSAPVEMLPDAEVTYGLSLIAGDGPNPIVWHPILVGPDRAAPWRSLKPGRYRVLRTLRVLHPGQFPDNGHWMNNEVTAEVERGKETVLPLLTWVADAAEPPAAPGEKPARAKSGSLHPVK